MHALGAASLLAGCGDDVSSNADTDEGSGTVSSEASTDTPTSVNPGTDTSSTSTGEDGETETVGDESSSTTTGDEPWIPPPLEGPSLALGGYVSCEVGDDGARRCWGAGDCGRFGDGTSWGRGPDDVDAPGTWRSIDLGFAHGCGIDDDGALWCWGEGLEGQVGDGELLDIFDPHCRIDRVEIDPGTRWARVAASWENTCGVQEDGTLWCWGNNDRGQIGDGSVGPLYARYHPVPVAGDDWHEVFVGDAHACARKSDGSLWCWGDGGMLGDGLTLFSSTPVPVMGPTSWTALARGGMGRHTCAIDDDATLWCWGESTHGALGTGDEEPALVPVMVDVGAPVVAVSTGVNNTCALGEEGQLWCWGNNRDGQLAGQVAGDFASTPVAIPGAWTEVRVGLDQVCARERSGAVRCWGGNELGQVGDGTSGNDNSPRLPSEVGVWGGVDPWPGFVEVATGVGHSCGRRDDDTVWCWGGRYRGALGNDDPVDDCSPANPNRCHFTTPVEVSGGHTWQTIAAGFDVSCGIDDNGILHCWGSGLGIDASVPVELPGADWTAISIGERHACGIQAPGALLCWGVSTYAQAGNGEVSTTVAVPTQVGTDTDFVAVSAGTYHTCAIRDGGVLLCWGLNMLGQVGNGEATGSGTPAETSVVSPVVVPGTWTSVSAGSLHTCAIASDGTLWCWGGNALGAVGDPPSGADEVRPDPVQVGTDTTWVEVAAGSELSCGRRADGTLWCWGSNHDGGVGNGLVERATAVDTPSQVGTETDWVGVSARGHVCGVRANGSLLCWGENALGQQGNDTVFISGEPREVRR